MRRTTPILLLALALALPLRADHGPGTSGGGLSVISGEVLKAGKLSLELRTDRTDFDTPSDAEIRTKAQAAGEIDLLDRSSLHTLSLGWGVAEGFQVSVTAGWYEASGGATAELDPDTGDVARTGNRPRGLTDTWVQGKWAFHKGPAGRFAPVAGVKLPTGRTDVKDEAGEPLDYASTPGSGAADALLGLGWSTYLTPRLTLDASASHTFRGTWRGYRLGDRTDLGAALAWRFTESIRHYPQASAFLELDHRSLGKIRSGGELDGNSGGRALFLSPGARLAFSPAGALTLALQLPLSQAPNGAQVETKFKAVAALAFTF